MPTHLDPELARAIRRQVGPKFDRYSRKKYGIPGVKLLGRVAAGEHGGQNDYKVRSSAGARGPFQFIGSTRDAYRKQYHVDPWKNADEAAKAAIIHIMGTDLKGYNPGMPTYTNYILGQRLDKSSRRILGHGGGGAGKGGGSTKLSVGKRPRVVGHGAGFDKRGFLLDYLQSDDKNKSLSGSLQHAMSSGAYEIPSTLRVKPGKLNKSGGKSASGLKLPKGSGKIFEVFYDPAGKYYDSGGIQKGAIGGHSDHVHVSADKHYVIKLGKLAQRMGLHVGENPHFGGVNPVHVNGSFHYKDMAIDVSGDSDKMAAFAKLMRHFALHGHGG